jgi:lipopolysaccharide export system protein LptA
VAGGGTHVTFTVEEGKQYRIGQVTINPATAALLTPMLSFKSGDIFDASKVKAALDAASPDVSLHLQRDPGGKPIINVSIDIKQDARHAALETPGGGNAAIQRQGALKPGQGPDKLIEAFLAITNGKGVQPPIDIRADRVRNDAQGRPTQFEGNATVRQGGITVRADSIRAEVAPAAPPSGGKLTRLIADGNVVLTQDGKSVRSDHLEVDVANNELKPEPPAAEQDHAAISDEMKLQLARQHHVTVSPAEVDARIAELKAQGALPPTADLDAQEAAAHRDALRAQVTAQLAWEKTPH